MALFKKNECLCQPIMTTNLFLTLDHFIVYCPPGEQEAVGYKVQDAEHRESFIKSILSTPNIEWYTRADIFDAELNDSTIDNETYDSVYSHHPRRETTHYQRRLESIQ